MNLRWGVMPFRLDFESDPEQNIDRTFRRAALFAFCTCLSHQPFNHMGCPADQHIMNIDVAFSACRTKG